MNNILSEKEYQHFIMDRLSQDNGYIVRKAASYDRLFAMDRELLLQFLNDTQPDEMAALRKIYKSDLEDTLVSFINAEVTKARGSLLDVLKHGIEISNMKLELMYLLLLQEVENQGKGNNPQHHQHQRNADYCGHDVDGAPAFLALYADHGEQEARQRKDDVADRPNHAYSIRQSDFQKHRDKGCQRQQTDNQRRQTELLKFFCDFHTITSFPFFQIV